jgi:hypothetical protein
MTLPAKAYGGTMRFRYRNIGVPVTDIELSVQRMAFTVH